MITESFINLCCVVILDEENVEVTDNTRNEIFLVLNTYNEEEVAIQSRKKFELAKTILKLRMDGKSRAETLDDITASNHFAELESYIKGLENRKLTSDKVDSALKQISERKQYCSVVQRDLPKVEEFIQKIRSSSFTDLGEAVSYWNQLIPQLHTRVLEDKRKESRAAIKELDLASDSYEEVLNQIAISYSGDQSVSTGYAGLDKYMNGGFEPTRLYIYGGTSGDGKSALLNNFLRNSVESNKDLSGPYNISMYFTLENLVDESLVRLYCSVMNEKVFDIINQYDEKRKTIEKNLKEWMMDHHSIIVMSYFPPTLTSVSDLISYSDMIKHRYEEANKVKAKLKITFTDYLDLLKSGQTFDLHRLELGQVTIDMKVAAVMQGIPWITVTQLNRSCCIYSRINIKGVGYTEFKNVKVGDEIENDFGFVKVKKVFPREIKKCYKITTKSGKTIICGPKHNFPTTTGLKNIQYTGLKVGDKLYVKNNDYRDTNQNKTMG